MSDIFAVIADPTRRQILSAIAEGPKSVSDLVTLTGLEQPAVSKHLKSLRDAGLASVTAQGQSRLYSAETAPLVPVADFVNDLLGQSPMPGSSAELWARPARNSVVGWPSAPRSWASRCR